MPAIEVADLTYRYGRFTALDRVDLEVPSGAVYALLGPNGAGKTTLLQVLMGLRRPTAGAVSLLGRPLSDLGLRDRAAIGYVAEGQRLPGWMTLDRLEAHLAPLYSSWDRSLARELRRRFRLDGRRRIRTLSRGERMKAALLCTLAPRPRLLLMDEPFTGMDALVKDELVRGLLESSGEEGWSVLLCSHDIGELESLADWVGILDAGRLRLSEPMERVWERFRRVEVVLPDSVTTPTRWPATWLSVERSGQRLSFITSDAGGEGGEDGVRRRLPAGSRVTLERASLREVFVALARAGAREAATPVAAAEEVAA